MVLLLALWQGGDVALWVPAGQAAGGWRGSCWSQSHGGWGAVRVPVISRALRLGGSVAPPVPGASAAERRSASRGLSVCQSLAW